MPTPFGLSWLLYLSAGVGLSTSIIPRKCYLLLNEAEDSHFGHSILFRISDFVLRILVQEQDFPILHCTPVLYHAECKSSKTINPEPPLHPVISRRRAILLYTD